MNRIARSVVGLCVLLGLVSCEGGADGAGTTQLTWTEDLSLSDGAVIRVYREQDVWFQKSLSDGVGTDQGRRSLVRSADVPSEFPDWQAPMIPVLLDRDATTGDWHLVAAARCSFWQRNQEPRPPYWGFMVKNGRWVRAPIPEAFWGRSTNLFARYDWTDTSEALQSSLSARKRDLRSQYVGDPTATLDRNLAIHCGQSSQRLEDPRELDLLPFVDSVGLVPAVPDVASAN